MPYSESDIDTPSDKPQSTHPSTHNVTLLRRLSHTYTYLCTYLYLATTPTTLVQAKPLIFAFLLSETAPGDRFYYGADFTGDYRAFSASQYEKCYKCPNGYARSIWADSSVNEWWTAYRRRRGGAVCGYSVCSPNSLNDRCCSVNGKFISSLIVHNPGSG